MVKILTLNLCECCAIVAANADDSGCRSYHEHDDHALSAVDSYVWVDGYQGNDETFTCDGCRWRIEYGTLWIGNKEAS